MYFIFQSKVHLETAILSKRHVTLGSSSEINDSLTSWPDLDHVFYSSSQLCGAYRDYVFYSSDQGVELTVIMCSTVQPRVWSWPWSCVLVFSPGCGADRDHVFYSSAQGVELTMIMCSTVEGKARSSPLSCVLAHTADRGCREWRAARRRIWRRTWGRRSAWSPGSRSGSSGTSPGRWPGTAAGPAGWQRGRTPAPWGSWLSRSWSESKQSNYYQACRVRYAWESTRPESSKLYWCKTDRWSLGLILLTTLWKSIDRSINRLINRSINQSVNQSIIQPVTHSVNRDAKMRVHFVSRTDEHEPSWKSCRCRRISWLPRAAGRGCRRQWKCSPGTSTSAAPPSTPATNDSTPRHEARYS